MDVISTKSFLAALGRWRGNTRITEMAGILAEHPGRVLTYDELIGGVWGYGRVPLTAQANLSKYACLLRKEGFAVKNYSGRGYAHHNMSTGAS